MSKSSVPARAASEDPEVELRLLGGWRVSHKSATTRVSVVLTALIFMAMAPAEAAQVARRSFTVEDSIRMTRMIDFSGDGGSSSSPALFSPDGSHFLLHTLSGDLLKNVLVESLLLFDSADVDVLLRRESSVPQAPQTLAEIDVAVDWGGISHVKWIDSGRVAFVAQAADGRNQAFVASIAGGSPTQLTFSKTDIASFDVADDALLYYAHVPAASPQVDVATYKTILDAIFPDRATETPLELFGRSHSGELQRVQALPRRLDLSFTGIWLSPKGNYAVVFAPATNAPKHWAEYRVPFYDLFGYTPDRVTADPTSNDLLLRTRYQLVDLRTNSVRDLLDAPSGSLSLNNTPIAVFWPDDEKSVIVSNTYLPLSVQDIDTRRERAERPAIAEVNIASGDIRTIAWEPVVNPDRRATGAGQEMITSIEWEGGRQILTVATRTSAGKLVQQQYRRNAGQWRRTHDDRAQAEARPRIELEQSLNERPKVFADGGACRCRRLLFDPNPGAEKLQFGRAEIYEWKDRNGVAWRGGLVYPTAYVAGTQYPLVVQTHGFNPNEFLIDGPSGITTAMAAQALANVGMLVLQVEDNRQAITLDEHEGPRVAEGIRSAVEHLIDAGLVDRSRVGVIGFSRTGYHVLHLLAQHPDLVAAVTISDAIQQGYVDDALLVNQSVDASTQIRKLSGGAPDLDDVGAWIARNPLYKLAKASAAFRLESNGRGGVIGLWETFAVLKESGRAVDFVYFPEGSHILRKPLERLHSQGGNVDWFRFWLQGYEDPSPDKAAQYSRWRQIRERASATKVE